MPAGMTTNLTAAGFKKLLLNAGAFVAGFDPSSYTSVAALKTALATALADTTKNLGMTRGGGTFTVTREMRQVEADGIRYRFVGDTFVDSADAYLSTTLLCNGDPNVVKNTLGTVTVTNVTGGKKMQLNTRIADTDYLEDLCWIGDIADGGLVVIHLANAFNTADFAMTITDKGEVTVPVEFHAFQSDVEDYDYAPFEIVFLDAPTVSVSVSPNMSEIAVNDTLQLLASGTPSGGSVAWASDDGDIATVGASTGLVTGVAAGTVTITATYTPTSGTAVTGKAVVRVTAS